MISSLLVSNWARRACGSRCARRPAAAFLPRPPEYHSRILHLARGFVVGIPRVFSISARLRTSRTSARCLPCAGRAGVLILRYRERTRKRPSRARAAAGPIVTIFTCLLLMAGLPIMIGYASYLAHHRLVIYYSMAQKEYAKVD